MTERLSLRERRRLETRAAISWAAIRLVVGRGLAQVTVEDIAAEAGVSPRTVNNYFTSKAEAIAARHHDRVVGIAEQVRARPAEEPIWEAITQAVIAWFENTGQDDHTRDGEAGRADQPGGKSRAPDSEWTQGVRLMMAEPALQGEFQKANAAAEIALSAVVAERVGAEVGRDLYPLLVATAAGAAMRAAMVQWARAEPPVAFGVVLRQAFGAVRVEL